MQAWLRFCPLGDDDEEEVGEGDDEADEESDGSLFSLGGDAQGHGDQGKSEGCQGEGEALVQVGFHLGELFGRVGVLGLFGGVSEVDMLDELRSGQVAGFGGAGFPVFFFIESDEQGGSFGGDALFDL